MPDAWEVDEEKAAQYRHALEQRLHDFVGETAGRPARFAVVEAANHGHGIAEYARRAGADLIVLGTKGRSNAHDLGTAGENPYVSEHRALVGSIRGSGPYINHAMAVAESTMTCIMARESAYTGEAITWDRIMASKLDLQPKSFGYDQNMNVPPLPVPGQYKLI